MFLGLNDRSWLWVAAGFYLAGFLQGTLALRRQGKPAGTATFLLLLLGLLGAEWGVRRVRGLA